MTAPEFSRLVRVDTIGAAPRTVTIEADEGERQALAARFGLPSIEALTATASLVRGPDGIRADGRFTARAVQSCVATAGAVPAVLDEPFALRFEAAAEQGRADEVELDADDLDVLSYEGGAIDLGEAVAQGFGLALDPFPRSPEADAHLRAAGVLDEEQAADLRRADSPFAVLKALKKDD